MQISSVSTIGFGALAATNQAKSTSAASPPNTASAATPVAPANGAAPPAAAAATPSTSAASGTGQAVVPAQSLAAALSTATSILDATTYSTNVAGKNYAANISQANGTYTLAVPNVPGSTVTGASLSAAENALNLKIDILA